MGLCLTIAVFISFAACVVELTFNVVNDVERAVNAGKINYQHRVHYIWYIIKMGAWHIMSFLVVSYWIFYFYKYIAT
jgi:hypothetical protein